MAKHAAHDILVTSDSDVVVDRITCGKSCRRCSIQKVGMLTCVYRGKNVGRILVGGHAIGMSVEMTAGVVTANLLEGMKFGLGPTIVVRRDALDKLAATAFLQTTSQTIS